VRLHSLVTSIGLTGFVFLLYSCQNMPAPYPLPAQQHGFENARPHRVGYFVDTSDPNSVSQILSGITPGGPAPSKWTLQNPAVRVVPHTNQGLRYTIDFDVPNVTFRVTGPVTLTFLVNGHVLESVRYVVAGSYHYEKPVPPDWMTPFSDTTLAVHIDKVFIAAADGAELGFILTRIGLTQ
jgi:hypothetical protein